MTKDSIIIDQLKTAIEFMENTPDYGKPWRDSTWWAGAMPADPDLYAPAEWQRNGLNWPIYKIWDQYLGDLRQLDLERYALAMQLEIADLLAASEREATGDEYDRMEARSFYKAAQYEMWGRDGDKA